MLYHCSIDVKRERRRARYSVRDSYIAKRLNCRAAYGSLARYSLIIPGLGSNPSPGVSGTVTHPFIGSGT